MKTGFILTCVLFAVAAFPVLLAIFGNAGIVVIAISAISALLIISRHKKNFVKLKNGTESKFSLK